MKLSAKTVTAPFTLIVALAVAIVALAGCSTGGTQKKVDSSSDVQRPSAALVAAATGDSISVFPAEDAPAPASVLPGKLPTGTPRSFLVLDDRGAWLRALLPDGPNGASGWLRRAEVSVSPDDVSVDVSLGAHELTVKQSGQATLTAPVGVGAPATPTPTGTFFITDLLQPPDPSGAYGPYAFGLSGHSQVLHSFAGGDGQIGLHGTDDPSSIGSSVTHGCIRMQNDTITQLARMLPLGTPVEVHA